jgi:hypothetical protein
MTEPPYTYQVITDRERKTGVELWTDDNSWKRCRVTLDGEIVFFGREDVNIHAAQDRVLIAISTGKMDFESLRSLPPWRAVLLARVACKAGVMTRADRDALIKEARDIGGNGKLHTPAQLEKLADDRIRRAARRAHE